MFATVSSDYKITIPEAICKEFNIQPGQEFSLFTHDGIIRLVPMRPIEEMEGFLKGIDATFEREPDREF